jgi:hypothetical protein
MSNTSLYFFGKISSYMTINLSNKTSNFNMNGDFTIQWWQKTYNTFTSVMNPTIFSCGTNPHAIIATSFENTNVKNKNITFNFLSNNNTIFSHDIQKNKIYNKWMLFTICRFSNIIYFYINGKYISSIKYSDNYNLNLYGLTIGNEKVKTLSSSFKGLLYDFIWINDFALHSSKSNFNVNFKKNIKGKLICKLNGNTSDMYNECVLCNTIVINNNVETSFDIPTNNIPIKKNINNNIVINDINNKNIIINESNNVAIIKKEIFKKYDIVSNNKYILLYFSIFFLLILIITILFLFFIYKKNNNE